MDIVHFYIKGFSSQAIKPGSHLEPIATTEMRGGEGLRPSLPSLSAGSGEVVTVLRDSSFFLLLNDQ